MLILTRAEDYVFRGLIAREILTFRRNVRANPTLYRDKAYNKGVTDAYRDLGAIVRKESR